MVLLYLVAGGIFVSASDAPGALPEYAFFAHGVVAGPEDGSENRWPCMAALADRRIMAVWSRVDPATGEDAVVAAFSTDCGCTWKPIQTLIAHAGQADADPSIVVSGDRVLVTCTTVSGEGIATSATWCVRSEDSGKTWSPPHEIPMNHRYTCGKTHRGLRLTSGTLLMGYSWDTGLEAGGALSSEGQMDLRAGVMRSTDNGETWVNGGDTHATFEKVSEGAVWGTDEPALAELDDGTVYMLMRTGSTHLYEARSKDEGVTWEDVAPSPLTGSNAPAALARFDVAGRTGVFAVWNNGLTRQPLVAAVSFDGCRTWTAPKDIAFPYAGDGQASYPSCVQAPDGALLAVWQQDTERGRAIRLARFSLEWLAEGTTSGRTPLTIVTFGDSTTAPRGPLRVFADLLREELPAKGVPVKVINAGVGGNTTDMARERFEKDVLAHKPAVVTIGFGLNDSTVNVWKGATEVSVPVERYRDNLRCFVQTLRAQGALPVLFTHNPVRWTPELLDLYGAPPYDAAHPDGLNALREPYIEAVRALAAEEGVPLVDIAGIFARYEEGDAVDRLLLDGMHPNDVAHRIIADEVIRVVIERFGPPPAEGNGR